MSSEQSTDDGERFVEVPEHELYGLYSTLADATEAAAAGDPNGCSKLAAEAKQQVMDIHDEHDVQEPDGDEQTPIEKWEEHNESFSYDPPELPGDAWSSEQYQELHDRVISRRVEWFCDKCTGRGPIGSLQKARRHVESNHSRELVEKYETTREEKDAERDGSTSASEIEQRQSENRGIGDFVPDDSDGNPHTDSTDTDQSGGT